MPRSDNLAKEAIYNNVTPPYSAVVYRYGSLYYAESALGERLINPRTEAGIVLTRASNYVNSQGGGIVQILEGTYSVSTQVNQASNVMFVGEGRSVTMLQGASTLASTMIVNSDQTNGNSYMGMAYLQIDMSAASTGACFNYTRVSQSLMMFNYFKGNANTFNSFWTGSTQADEDNVIIGNIWDGHADSAFDQFGGGRLTDSFIGFNTFVNGEGTGCLVQRLPLRCVIMGNHCYNSGAGGISLETSQYCMIIGNNCHDMTGSGIKLVSSADGSPVGCVVIGNICKDNTDTTSSARGISTVGNEHVVVGNWCSGNDGPGIEILGDDTLCSNNFCKNNGKNTSLANSFQTGIRITNGVDNIITGNRCFDDSTSTQLSGIEEAGTADFNIIMQNNVRGNATVGIVRTGTDTLIRDNIGHTTEAKGTGSIASGATTAVITHGLAYTPVAAEINIVFTENPTNTAGTIWIDTITSTQFTVNCENDPGASNLDFGWSVRRI